jgi:oligosaccharide repeat unit polymerase
MDKPRENQKIAVSASIIGAVSMLSAYFVALGNSDKIIRISIELHFYVWYSIAVMFFLSIVQSRLVSLKHECKQDCKGRWRYKKWFFVTAVITIFGAVLRLIELRQRSVGMLDLLNDLIYDPLSIRGASSVLNDNPIAIQCVYLSWLAAALAVTEIIHRKSVLSRLWLSLFVLAVLLYNASYVDRTKPMWLICTVFVAVKKPQIYLRATNAVLIALSGFLLIVVFIIFQSLTGKYDEKGMFEGLMYYIIGPFGYLQKITDNGVNSFTLERSLYPVFKFLAGFGLVNQPPEQVLQPEFVPFWFNTGTFLEPFYSDFGPLGILIGVPAITLLLNKIWLNISIKKSIISWCLNGTILFNWLVCPFTPKWCSVPLYLFVLIAIIDSLRFDKNEKKRVDLNMDRVGN